MKKLTSNRYCNLNRMNKIWSEKISVPQSHLVTPFPIIITKNFKLYNFIL